MSQCIHLACKEEAWSEPPVHYPGEAIAIPQGPRSYFCLEHAYRAARGHLLFTPPQWDVFNQEGFIDSLVEEKCGHGERLSEAELFDRFPAFYLAKDRHTKRPKYRPEHNVGCFNCGKPIMTGYRYCGACRVAKGLPEDEEATPTVTCEHWRAKEEPGHFYLRECERLVRTDRIVDCHGHRWCPSCRAYVLGIRKSERIRAGYDF